MGVRPGIISFQYCKSLGYKKPLPLPKLEGTTIKADNNFRMAVDWLVGKAIRYFYADEDGGVTVSRVWVAVCVAGLCIDGRGEAGVWYGGLDAPGSSFFSAPRKGATFDQNRWIAWRSGFGHRIVLCSGCSALEQRPDDTAERHATSRCTYLTLLRMSNGEAVDRTCA